MNYGPLNGYMALKCFETDNLILFALNMRAINVRFMLVGDINEFSADSGQTILCKNIHNVLALQTIS